MSSRPVENLVPKTVTDTVYEYLKASILNGDLDADERLLETSIAERLGVSRTPVRESIRRLEVDGLVQTQPRYGSVVARLDLPSSIEIFQMRAALEGLAGRWAAERATPAQLAKLDRVIDQMAEGLASGDVNRAGDSHNAFNLAVLEASSSQMLPVLVRNLYERLSQIRRVSLSTTQRRQEALEECKKIVVAIKSGDPDAAEAAIRIHLENAQKSFVSRFQETI